jgi:hypothetical protein
MADDDDDLLGRQLGQRVEDMEDHGPTTQTVQGLRTRRAHPCPLAGGEHDSRQRTVGHAFSLSPDDGGDLTVHDDLEQRPPPTD